MYETLVTEYNPDRRREQRGARLGLAERYKRLGSIYSSDVKRNS